MHILNTKTSWFGTFLIALILLISQTILNLELRNADVAWVELPDEMDHKWNPQLFKVLSFGHLPAAIDWVWIRCLVDPEMDHVAKGKHPAFYYNLDLLTDLDPQFFDAYVAGANVLAVVRDDIVGARDLLLKGDEFRKGKLPSYTDDFRERFWGNAWTLPLTLGYVYLFELNDMHSAASAFREAAEFPSAPPYLFSLAKRFERPGGEYEVGIRLLNFMISSSKDNRVKSELEKKVRSLFVGQYLHELNRNFSEYLQRQPRYKKSTQISLKDLHNFWYQFRRDAHVPRTDPLGGEIKMDENGKITSTTERIKVFGLE